MLKVTFKENECEWSEFKKQLRENDDDDFRGLRFSVQLPKQTLPRKEMTNEEYQRLVNPLSRRQSELAQLRADWQSVRRETIWLINALFAVLGAAVFTFLASYRFSLEARIGLTAFVSTAVFIIEVLLYIIRS